MPTRAASLAALALLAAGLPGLQPATAADPPGSTQVAVLATGDGKLLQFTQPDGPRTAFGDVPVRVKDLAVSRDGSRVVTDEQDQSPNIVGIRDISGTSILRWRDNNDYDLGTPELSPDGNLFAYDDPFLESFDTGQPNVPRGVELIDISLGLPPRPPLPSIRTTSGSITNEQVFLTPNVLLVKDQGSSARLARFRAVGVLGAANRTLVGLPETAATQLTGFALDPSGAQMVYVRLGGASRSVEVVSVAVSATQVVFGRPRVLATGSVAAPAFTRDGRTVVYTRGVAPDRDLFWVPAAGGTSVRYGPATPDVDEVAVVFGARDTVPPGAVPLGSPVLNGVGTAVPLRLTDPALGALRVTTTAEGEPGVTQDFRFAGTSLAVGSSKLGRAYTVSVRALDRSGNLGPETSARFVATVPPVMETVDPTSSPLVSSEFSVDLGTPSNAADTRYTVDYRVQGRTAWERLVTLTTARSVRSQGAPGQTYAFRGAAVDRFGNATEPTPGVRAVVPFDQQRAAYAGSTSTALREGAYGGTVTFLRAAGATATLRSAGDRLQLIGERCPACGAFDVYLDGMRKARVDTRSADRTVRTVLWTSPVQFTNKVRTMTVRAVGTPGRPGVVVDALAGRRFGLERRSGLTSGQELRLGGRLRAVMGSSELTFRGLLFLGRGDTPTPPGGRLVMQTDGNLVIYDGRRAVWSSRTNGNPSSSLVLQPNGELIVYRGSDGRPLWTRAKGRLY